MDTSDHTRSRAPTALLTALRRLELELHHPGNLCTRERLDQLLHPEFHEVGRSGRRYDRDTVLRVLATQSAPPATESDGFELRLLSANCALLTYRSLHRDPDGTESSALRSSVWLHGATGWQLYYHQGTPAPRDG